MTDVIPWTAKREITLRTLTPLWTGGATGSMDRVHETGLLGSLRWWYEALVRGVGSYACDPAGNSRCGLNSDATATIGRNPEVARDRIWMADAKVCDVCQLFGATGWRRRFRAAIDGTALKLEERHGRQARIQLPDKQRPRSWTLPPGCEGTLRVILHGAEEDTAAMAALIRMMASYGALGARTQLGYGLIDILKVEPEVPSAFPPRLARIRDQPHGWVDLSLPASSRMFVVNLWLPGIRDDDPIQELLMTKFELRELFRLWSTDELLRHTIMGTTNDPNVADDGRCGATISVSRPYRLLSVPGWHVRLWGWAPTTHYADVIWRLGAYVDHRQANGDAIQDELWGAALTKHLGQ